MYHFNLKWWSFQKKKRVSKEAHNSSKKKITTAQISIISAHFFHKIHYKSPTELSMKKCLERKCSHIFGLEILQIWWKWKKRRNKLQIFIDKISWKMLLQYVFWLVGVVHNGWIGRCSKGEISHPEHLLVSPK